MTDKNENNNLINKAARDILTLARSLLIVRLRFLDIAIGRLELIPADGKTLSTDGVRIIYGPKHVVRSYKSENERPARDYLHMVLHCIFSHMFVGNLESPELWDLACDIAVESTINDLGLDVTLNPKPADSELCSLQMITPDGTHLNGSVRPPARKKINLLSRISRMKRRKLSPSRCHYRE